MSKIFSNIETSYCCSPDNHCMCGDEETILRAYTSKAIITTMTEEQKLWCINEAVYYGEGEYKEEELSLLNDSDLARSVLLAWNSYMQSNCYP